MTTPHSDDNIRRTLKFFAKFVVDNQMPPQQISDLLVRTDAYIGALEDAVETNMGFVGDKQRDALLSANEELVENYGLLVNGLREIVANAPNEPAAADYANDILKSASIQGAQ